MNWGATFAIWWGLNAALGLVNWFAYVEAGHALNGAAGLGAVVAAAWWWPAVAAEWKRGR